MPTQTTYQYDVSDTVNDKVDPESLCKDVEAPGSGIQAKLMDPTPAPGLANVLQVYIYHPAGESHEHILRLVTYRPPGTS